MQANLFSSFQQQRHTSGLHSATVYSLDSRRSRPFLLCPGLTAVNRKLSNRSACSCSVQQATQLSPDPKDALSQPTDVCPTDDCVPGSSEVTFPCLSKGTH
ncbi:hypothetical protein WJX82_005433 [Trebouxia sp. C0006]